MNVISHLNKLPRKARERNKNGVMLIPLFQYIAGCVVTVNPQGDTNYSSPRSFGSPRIGADVWPGLDCRTVECNTWTNISWNHCTYDYEYTVLRLAHERLLVVTKDPNEVLPTDGRGRMVKLVSFITNSWYDSCCSPFVSVRDSLWILTIFIL
jgi:hypothetical protein